MSNPWIPADEMKSHYGDRVMQVSHGSIYILPLSSGDSSAFVGLGGDIPLPHSDLERRFVDSFLEHVGGLQDMAIRLCSPVDGPAVLTDENKVKVPFRYIIGLVHPFGTGSNDEDDLNMLLKAGAHIAELRQARYSCFWALGDPNIIPGSNPKRYYDTIVGNLPDLMADGKIKHSLRTHFGML